jgi:hypothetical protein
MPDALEFFTHATKAYETLHDDHKRAIYDDEMTSDTDFFSMEIAGVKVNLLYVFFSVGIGALSLIAYLKLTAGPSTEGRCPIDHTKRSEMVEHERAIS